MYSISDNFKGLVTVRYIRVSRFKLSFERIHILHLMILISSTATDDFKTFF